MSPEDIRAATVRELQRELEAARRDRERLQSALYDLELKEAAPGKEASYRQLVRRVRETVRTALPRVATVVVVSKGDPALQDLYGRDGWHFPQTADGRYGGYYPKRGLSVIAHLEAVRARGGEFLLIPETALWWLDHYPDWRDHLERRYRCVVDDPDTCLVYSLTERPPTGELLLAELRDLIDERSALSGAEPTILDWGSGLALEEKLPQQLVFSPALDADDLPYLDETVDIVATDGAPDRLTEAWRVASIAVVSAAGTDDAGNGRPVDVSFSLERKPPSDARGLPSVSIVIPCHNGERLTRGCLATLLETLPAAFEGEILVVDDASSDGTAELIAATAEHDDRVRAVRNARCLGFLGSCNRAALEARGEYLLFLNNDTVLLPGWLPPLLGTFSDLPAAGAVGGRLLYPDGRLQEAGGVVFADGSAWKFGYGDPDPDRPLFRHTREVDYVSGALLMTPRELFADIGSFDARYGFGFYEDDDYCFAVRAAGHRVYYQPQSVIVHLEGGSAGVDLSAGAKRYQATNQAVFAKKWSEALRSQPKRPDPIDTRAELLLAARGCAPRRSAA